MFRVSFIIYFLPLSGELQVIYPGLDIDKCLVIPKNQNLREKVSTVWKAPQVYYSVAQKVRACICSVVKTTQKSYLSESKDIMLKNYFVKNDSHMVALQIN